AVERVPVRDLVLPELPAEKNRLASSERREVDEAFVDVLDLHAQAVELVDGMRELALEALHLRRRLGELCRRNAAAVPADVPFELLLPLERLHVRPATIDHLLDERTNLCERGIRLFRSEVAHDCNPMRREAAPRR